MNSFIFKLRELNMWKKTEFSVCVLCDKSVWSLKICKYLHYDGQWYFMPNKQLSYQNSWLCM